MTREDRTPLARLTGHPYAVRLGTGPAPEQVLRQLSVARPPLDHISALWGDWFGGGVVLLHSPRQAYDVGAALDAAGLLVDQPELRPAYGDGAPLVGGGWLACLAYSADRSWLGFYDSLLRWQDGRWTFESLGLEGDRDESDRRLEHWRQLLVDAAEPSPQHVPDPPTPSWQVGDFSTAQNPAVARRRHLAAVEEAVGRIHRGDFYQVNLCTRLYADVTGDPVALFADLASALQPSWGALLSPGAPEEQRTVASFSPELFLRVSGRRVTTSPIKGTAPRRPAEESAPMLRASAKDAAENIMIVDLMRNDLSRVAAPGSVAVTDLLGLEPHPGVWHLVSTVTAELRPEIDLADLLRATFPPGSVTGAPKHTAVQGIA
ncbi:MAG: chorismate-binding protein, partial [Propionibacteriaceae bacterium]